MDDEKDTLSKPPRRDFLFLATGAVAALGAVTIARPLIGHMSPAADVIAEKGIEIDLSKLEEGQELRVLFKSKPIAIRHRTPSEIKTARDDDTAELIHQETDESRLRVKPNGQLDPRFLVFFPICSHFGCVVISQMGDFDGWYCACHSAHFDISGRVRKGPAPTNMAIPAYKWVSDTVINIADVRA